MKRPSRPKARKARPAKKAKAAKSKPMSAAQYRSYLRYLRSHPLKKAPAAKPRTLSLRNTGEPVKLGRNTPYTEEEKFRLNLAKYLDFSALPAPPVVVDRASKVTSWPMYGNDTIGDCTCATVGHQIQALTTYASTEETVPESSVIELYSSVSGYDPVTGANDNGAVIQDVINYWRKHGVENDPGKVLAFAQLKQLDSITTVRQVLEIFGTVYIGLDVPQSAMDQFRAGEPWTVVNESPVEGGHAVPVQYIDGSANPVGVITWAKLQVMSWEFWTTYVEEAWVVITQDWLEKNGSTIEGFSLTALGADFAAITGEPNPFPGPQPPVPPAPAPGPPEPTPVPGPPPAPDPTWWAEFITWIEGIFG
jgi:hypothetical protein